MSTDQATTLDHAVEAPDVVIKALADAIYSCDSAPLLNARTVASRWAVYQAQARNIAWPMLRDALLSRPEVLRALVGETVREWGACDMADDPNDPNSDGGVDPADDEDDAQKIAASWSSGRACWRDVTYGPWRTR